MLQTRIALAGCACATLLRLAVAPAAAQTNAWRGPDGGSWQQGTNWTLNHVPLSTEDVEIDNGTTAQLDVPELAQAQELKVGDAHVGGLRHTIGDLTVDSALHLGYGTDGNGTYELSGSPDVELRASYEYIAYQGVGEFVQSGGTNSVWSDAHVGYWSGSTGTYTQSGGLLDVNDGLIIGESGTGRYVQTGGATQVGSRLDLGISSTGNGTYELSGPPEAQLSAEDESIAYEGTGHFIQTGGTNLVGSTLWVGGVGAGAHGTYELHGPDSVQLLAYHEQIGSQGTATFIQSGGTNTTDVVWVGQSRASVGSYAQSGGTVTVWNMVFLGLGAEGAGRYELRAGEFEAKDLYVGGWWDPNGNGGSGEMAIWPAGGATVTGTLKLWPDGQVDLYGGTLSFWEPDALVKAGGTFNYHCGTVEFDCGVLTVGGNATLTELFGPEITIPAAKTLSVPGMAILAEPVTLDGGTLAVGDIANSSLLTFKTGTLRLTQVALSIEPGGLLGWDVTVVSGQAIEVPGMATVAAAGQLTVDGGRFHAGQLFNYGHVRFGSGGGVLDGVLTNCGFVSGGGTISATLANWAAGEISVGAGERLMLTGPGGTNGGAMIVDSGSMELLGDLLTSGQINVSDGTFRAGEALTNSGQISVYDGALRTGGVATNMAAGNIAGQGTVTLAFSGGLDNSGVVGVSFAEAQIVGNITNRPGGLVSVAGTSKATFVGELAPDQATF